MIKVLHRGERLRERRGMVAVSHVWLGDGDSNVMIFYRPHEGRCRLSLFKGDGRLRGRWVAN
jgi:hypothetical protein